MQPTDSELISIIEDKLQNSLPIFTGKRLRKEILTTLLVKLKYKAI